MLGNTDNTPMSMESMPVRRSVGERLEQERQELKSRLEQVETALDALKSNPEVERIINLVSKVQDRY